MRYRVTHIVVALLWLAASGLEVQGQDLKQDLALYKSRISKPLWAEAQKDDVLHAWLSAGNKQLVILPPCRSHSSSDRSFYLDTMGVVYQLVPTGSRLFCVPMPRRSFDTGLSCTGPSDSESVRANPFISMAEALLHTAGSDLFWVRMPEPTAWGNDPIAVLDGSSIRLIDRALKTYPDYSSLVAAMFGSTAAFDSALALDALHRQVTKTLTLDRCKYLLHYDYAMWGREHPEDTATVLDLFLKEVDSLAGLTAAQSSSVAYKVRAAVATPSPSPRVDGILVLETDVQPVLASVLTAEQLTAYRNGRALQSWMVVKAMRRLNFYYLTQRKVPLKDIDQVMKAEVF